MRWSRGVAHPPGRMVAAATVLVLAVAGCGSTGDDVPAVAGSSGAGGPCLDVAGPAASAGPSGAGAASDSGRPALPDLALHCLDGGATIHVGQLRGPAVVNLWASWCPPCRTELPSFERFAGRAAGRVAVVGVNTTDTRRGSTAIVEDFRLTFPVLVDDDGALLRATVSRQVLPVTLFVDRDGRIAHTYQDVALDDATLSRLVEQHLGVAVG